MNTPHPCVVSIDHRSKPAFCSLVTSGRGGPAGRHRVVYPKPPLKGLDDVDLRFDTASTILITEPLYAMLKPGMKITIAVDDISLPLPPMKTRMCGRGCSTLCWRCSQTTRSPTSTSSLRPVHRPMTSKEIKRMVGAKNHKRFWPDRLYNHDAEKPGGMTYLGTTEAGEEVEINKRAADSDLIIYLNLNFVPMDGGHKSVAVGLCGYRSLKPHHNPYAIGTPFLHDPMLRS